MSSEADQLVERIRERDADALAEFITLRQRQLMAYIDRQLGPGLRSKMEPDDVFQEMSTDAVRSLPQVKLEDRDPFGWLCQIAERRIIDAHRRFFGTQKRAAAREVSLGSPGGNSSRAALIDLLVMTMTTASQAFSRDQREIRILDALNSLRDDQREALRLRYMEGLPSKEIAQRLGKSDGAVRVMLSRSLNRLQEILGPEVAP